MIPLALGLIGKVAAAAVLPRVVTAVCDLVRGAENHRDSVRERCTDETSNRNNPVNWIDPSGLNALLPTAHFSYWIVPTNAGYDLAVIGHTDDLYFPAATFNITIEAPFRVMSNAGDLGTRWRTLGSLTVSTLAMVAGRGATAHAEIPGFKLRSLAAEGVCEIRITFAGQNNPLTLFSSPVSYIARLNADGTLSNIELMDLHLGTQTGRARGPSRN